MAERRPKFAPAPHVRGATCMTGKGSIVVVDDEPESLALLTEILAEQGYQIRPANSGPSALASVAVEPPELILIDIRMPGMDGFEVCRRLKESEESRNIPLIFITASNNEEEHVKGLSQGGVDFITKPFRREELLARVRTHLELGRLQTRLEKEVAQRTTALRVAVERLKRESAERMQAEAELRESEERFRTMADAAPVLIWAAGIDKLCTFFNKGWLEFTGRSLEDELGCGWAKGVHPDDLERCFTTYCSAFDEHRSFQVEYRLRRADGEYRWLLDRGVARFSRGIFLGYIGSCIDITDLKQAQEESVARQKRESMGLMAAGIAHDFNNLLGTILASVELAAMARDDGSSHEDELGRIKIAAIRGTELVRELMIYAGRENPAFQLVDINSLINEMLHLLRVAISKQLTLKIDLSEDVPAVRASSTQLRQVVVNLITNASDAVADRPGEIRVSTQVVRLGDEISSVGAAKLPDGDYLCLQVSDTGTGMTPPIQARIFDPFFSTKNVGRGLGLAVVQGIVRSHGGAIRVASEPGKGTTFEIFLPLAAVG